MKENEALIINRAAASEMNPRPCCCCLDVRIGSVLIGLFHLVFHFASLIIATSVMLHPSVYKKGGAYWQRMAGDNYIGMTLACLSFFITVMLIYGALMHQPSLILPFFAVQVIDIILFVLGAAGTITYGAEVKFRLENCQYFRYKDTVAGMSLYTFIFFLVVTCLGIMFIKVYLMACVWECYHFVKRQYDNSGNNAFHTSLNEEVPLPNYEEAIKIPKEMPPPYISEY